MGGEIGASGRRERQLLELLRLSASGDRRRAAGLAIEHAIEFPADAATVAGLADWFEARRTATGA